MTVAEEDDDSSWKRWQQRKSHEAVVDDGSRESHTKQ
ncbi:hypothetical protein CDAR_590701, partial [Caerostris darwini]